MPHFLAVDRQTNVHPFPGPSGSKEDVVSNMLLQLCSAISEESSSCRQCILCASKASVCLKSPLVRSCCSLMRGLPRLAFLVFPTPTGAS